MIKNVTRAGTRGVIAALMVLAVMGLAACGGAGSDSLNKTANTLKVTLTEQGCSPARLSTPSGPVTFAVVNGGAPDVSEMELKSSGGIILGERENIVSGLSGSFSLSLKPGEYVMNCPNGDKEDNGVLVVTGNRTAVVNTPAVELLHKAVVGYGEYVRRETQALLSGTHAFFTALQQGNVERSKMLFGPVRRHYEAIEPVAESFGNLDPAIDARINDVPSVKQWTGFHRIEQILWTKNTTRGTVLYAKKLLADVVTLKHKVQTLDYQAPQLANGAVELLNEVANSKITGEEDRYSHTDLSDFEGNLTGARVAFEQLRPALTAQGAGSLGGVIAIRFAAVQRGLDVYRRNTPLGFAYYGSLTPNDRRRFAQQVDALAEPLSTVAARVAG